VFTDGQRESDVEEDAGGGSRDVGGRASDAEERGDITGDEGIDGDSKGELGHDDCLSAERRRMTGIWVCWSLDIVLEGIIISFHLTQSRSQKDLLYLLVCLTLMN